MFCSILLFSFLVPSAFPAETTDATVSATKTYLAELTKQRSALVATEKAATKEGEVAQNQCQAARTAYETARTQVTETSSALATIRMTSGAAETYRAELTQAFEKAEKASSAAKTAATKAGTAKMQAAKELAATKVEIEKVDAEILRATCVITPTDPGCPSQWDMGGGVDLTGYVGRVHTINPLPTEFAPCFPGETVVAYDPRKAER